MVVGRKSDARGKRLAFAGHQLQPFAKLVVGLHDLVELGPADQAVPLPIVEAFAHELRGLQEVLPRGRRMAGRALLAGRGQALTTNSTDETGGRGRHATLPGKRLNGRFRLPGGSGFLKKRPIPGPEPSGTGLPQPAQIQGVRRMRLITRHRRMGDEIYPGRHVRMPETTPPQKK